MSKVVVKQEVWKGKLVVTARRDGKLKTWTIRDVNKPLKYYSSKYQRSLGFRDNVSVHRLTEVVEFTDYGKKPSINSNKFQYVIEGELKNGQIVVARSLTHEKGYSLSMAREEAIVRLNYLLSQAVTGNYDADEGATIFETELESTKEGVVYYKDKAMT